METITLLELFAGIGSPYQAFKNIGVDVEVVDVVEYNKPIINVYNALHDTNWPTKDIKTYHYQGTKEVDILTNGFPCQSFSNAGPQILVEGKDSMLYLESLRVIHEVKPKIVLTENVLGFVQKKFKKHFDHYMNFLKNEGYENYSSIVDSRDFGMPQARRRSVTISIRKDQNKFKHTFDFDKLIKTPMKKLELFIDKEVDDSYYIEPKAFSEAIKRGKVIIVGGGLPNQSSKQQIHDEWWDNERLRTDWR